MNKKPLIIVAVLLLLCGGGAGWLVLKSRHKKAPNLPPIAALRLDSVDETNRVVTLSDGGSRDPDGTLRSWRITWGDGNEENLSSIPQKASHTYASEGEYAISLWCVDNLGATSSPPAITNITFDFEKRQLLVQLEAKRQAEAQREADRLKEEQARKEAERLEQEKALAAEEARKAKEREELEAKRNAEAERSRQIAREALAAIPPDPLAKELPDNTSNPQVIYTPAGFTLGEFQIFKEKIEGTSPDGNTLVVLAIRCVNFPVSPIVTTSWRIDGKDFQIAGGRIRLSLPPGPHDITAFPKGKAGLVPAELMADVTVGKTGDCIVKPRN
jgi:hypothetical protein